LIKYQDRAKATRTRERSLKHPSLSRDRLRETVFGLLYGDRRWRCTLSSDNSRRICSTSNVSTNRRNIHHRQALLWRFAWFWHRTQNRRLTYLLTDSKRLLSRNQEARVCGCMACEAERYRFLIVSVDLWLTAVVFHIVCWIYCGVCT